MAKKITKIKEELFKELTAAVEARNTKGVQSLLSDLDHQALQNWKKGSKLLLDIISSGHIDIAKALIAKGCCARGSRNDGKTALHLAVVEGDLELIEQLRQKGLSFFKRDKKKMTPFFMLAYRLKNDNQFPQIFNFLVRRKADINRKHSENGNTLLHFSVDARNKKMVQLILEKKCHLNAQSNNGQTALHVAAMKGDVDIVSMLLTYGFKHNLLDNKDEGPLSLAVKSGNIQIVEVLLNQELQTNGRLQNEEPLIYHAVNTGEKALVELLLSKKADVNIHDPHTGKTPLHLAVEKGNENFVDILLKSGAEPKIYEEFPRLLETEGKFNRRTALHIAVEKDYTRIVDLLLQKGALSGALDEFGRNPLHLAARIGSLPIAIALLENNAGPLSLFTQAESEGFTPLHIAVENGSEDIVELFLKGSIGVTVDMPTRKGLKPLHIAVQKENNRMVKLLLKYGADVHASVYSYIQTPLYFAAEVGNLEIVEILSEASTTRSTKWIEAYFLLYIASYQGHENVVKMFLENRVNPNENLGKYLTPLHAAAQRGHLNVLKLLLQFGAKINSENMEACCSTPLLAAVHANHENVIFTLMALGADISVKLRSVSLERSTGVERLVTYGDYADSEVVGNQSKIGFTLLHFAVESGNETVVKKLLNLGAEVNVGSETGVTPLSIAVVKNRTTIVGFLLAAGAKTQDSFLHTAIFQKNESIVRMLLEAGVDVNARFGDGLMPLALAVKLELSAIVHALLEAGAKVTNVNIQGAPILNFALSKRNSTIAEMLLKAEVNINVSDKLERNKTALGMAVEHGLETIVQYLLQNGADVHIQWNGLPVLNIAVSKKNTEITEMLLNAGSEVNVKSDPDQSLIMPALHIAVITENEMMVQILLNHGADANVEYQKNTPVCLAVEREFFNITKFLLEAGADPNAKSSNSEPILFTAIVKKNREIVDLILEHHALINFTIRWNPHLKVTKLESLLEYQPDYTPLQVAVLKSSVEIVETLLLKGSVVDMEAGDFPLHIAVERGDTKIIEILLKYGANINSVCKLGRTPLIHALGYSKKIVAFLLEKGAAVDLETKIVKSILHYALDIETKTDIIELLLDCGVDVNAERNSMSALCQVVERNNLENYDDSDVEGVYSYRLCRCPACAFYGWNVKFDGIHPIPHIQEEKERWIKISKVHRSIQFSKLLLEYGANAKGLVRKNGKSILYSLTRQRRFKEVELLIQSGTDINSLFETEVPYPQLVEGKITSNLEKTDFESEKHNPSLRKCARLITKEIARLKALNEEISPGSEDLIGSKFFKEFFLQCQKEIEEMRSVNISSRPYLNYFDLLLENRSKVANCIKSKNVVESLESFNYVSRFPLYGNYLEARIKEAKARRVLLDMSQKPLRKVFKFKLLPEIVDEISDYLTSRDLRNFCIACNRTVFLKAHNSLGK